jgi:hypothetical protein
MRITPAPIGEPDPDPIVLLKENGWTLEKWHESDTESQMWHYCPQMQWKKHIGINEVRQGYCTQCLEDAPLELVGAYTMHNWQMLQQHDAEMAKWAGLDEEVPLVRIFK